MSARELSGSPAEMVSVAEFARRAGCHERQVRRAVEGGRLSRNSAGLLDAAQVGTGWRKPNKRTTTRTRSATPDNTKLSASARADNLKLSASSASRKRVVRKGADPSSAADLRAADGAIDDEALERFADHLLEGRYASLNDALRIKENALAMKHLIAARREAGSVIDVERAEAIMFEAARQARDAWIGFPARFAALIALDLGIDDGPATERLRETLEQYVHAQLTEISGGMAGATSPFADTTAT